MKFQVCKTIVFVFGIVVVFVRGDLLLVETIMGLYLVHEIIAGELKEAASTIFRLTFVISGITKKLKLLSLLFNTTFVSSVF